MMSNTKISIRFFDDREVRAVWDEQRLTTDTRLLVWRIVSFRGTNQTKKHFKKRYNILRDHDLCS
jgi:hypothetical protein